MRLVTWNLNGLDAESLDERTEAAVFIAVTGQTLRQLARGAPPHRSPDVLLFQEVVPHTYRAHLRPHLTRAGYVLSPDRPPERETFEVIAVRKPARILSVSSEPLERSIYGRWLHIVEIEGIPGIDEPVRVLTAHFDSGVEESAIRVAETLQVAGRMHARSIFGGDCNLRTSEWDEASAELDIADGWQAAGSPAELKRTWRIGGRGSRFDRIWTGPAIRTQTMTAIGSRPLPRIGVPPSDHIGLLVELSLATGTSPER